MATFFIAVAIMSWIACSYTVGVAAGRYFNDGVPAWIYFSLSLVLSPLFGGLCLFANYLLDIAESRI